jgi:glucokinase
MNPGDLLDAVSVDALRTEDLLDAARRGNRFALDHFRETAYFLGWGISHAVNLLNPEIVVLGTVATAAGEFFFESLREYVRLFAMTRSAEAVRVVPAALGDLVGDYAAIALVHQAGR